MSSVLENGGTHLSDEVLQKNLGIDIEALIEEAIADNYSPETGRLSLAPRQASTLSAPPILVGDDTAEKAHIASGRLTYAQAPGAEIMDYLNVQENETRECPKEWRVAKISCSEIPIDQLRIKLLDLSAIPIAYPPQTSNQSSMFVMFEDEGSLDHALEELKKADENFEIGFQSEADTLKVKLFNGLPVFFGDAMLQVEKIHPKDELKAGTHRPSATVGTMKQIQDLKAPASRTLQTVAREEHLNWHGAIAIVHLEDGFFDEDGNLTPTSGTILSQLDMKKERVFPVGNTLYVISQKMAADGRLLARLQTVHNERAPLPASAPSGAVGKRIHKIRFAVQAGDLTTRDINAGVGPRVIESEASAILDGFVSEPTLPYGAYGTAKTAQKMQGYRSGVLIPPGSINELDLANKTSWAHFPEITEKTGEITIDGPRLLVGREKAFERCMEALQGITTGSGPAVIVIDGPAGIGKSFFVQKLIQKAKEEGLITHSYEAKALDEDTAEKPFEMIRELIGQMAKRAQEKKISLPKGFYALNAFVSGKLRDHEQAKQIFSNDPSLCAKIILEAYRIMGEIAAVAHDDLQWCDDRSADILAMMTTLAGDDDSIVFFDLSRSLEEEFPAVIRRANSKVEDRDPKERKGRVHRESLDALQLFEPDVYGDSPSSTDSLRKFVASHVSDDEWQSLAPNIPETFLVAVAKPACDPDTGKAVPFYMAEILRVCFMHGYISYEDDGTPIFADAGAINPSNLVLENVIQSRFGRLTSVEQRICKLLCLFPGGISQALFGQMTHGTISPAHFQGLADKEFIKIDDNGMRFAHDLLAKTANNLYSPHLSAEAYIINSMLDNNWNEALQTRFDEINPAARFELIRRIIKGVEYGTADFSSLKKIDPTLEAPNAVTLVRRAFFEGLTALPKLLGRSNGMAARNIGTWIYERPESTRPERPESDSVAPLTGAGQHLRSGLNPDQERNLHVALTRAYEMVGEFDKSLKHAELALKNLDKNSPAFDATEKQRAAHWLQVAQVHAAKCRAAVASKNPINISTAFAALQAHAEQDLEANGVTPDAAKPFLMAAQIADAVALYYQDGATAAEEDRTNKEAIAKLEKVTQSLSAEKEPSRESAQALAEARFRIIQVSLENEIYRRKHFGDADAKTTFGVSKIPEVNTALRSAIQHGNQLLEQNKAAGNTLITDKKRLALTNLFIGRAYIMLGDRQEADLYFDQAKKISAQFIADYAWNLREATDWRVGYDQQKPGGMTTEETVKHIEAYLSALNELKQLDTDSSPRKMPTHRDAQPPACNAAKLLITMAQDNPDTIYDKTVTLRQAWDLAFGAIEAHVARRHKPLDSETKRFVPDAQKIEEGTTDLYQGLVSNIGALLKLKDTYNFEIPDEDMEWLRTNLSETGPASVEHISSKIAGGIEQCRKNEEEHMAALARRDENEVRKLLESNKNLDKIGRELRWKLAGAREFERRIKA